MASFQIHEDQENRVLGREIRQKQNVNAVFGQQKRAVLGVIENKPVRAVKAKQPLLNNQNVSNKTEQKFGCKSIPVVPVAQFQAFKVYEDQEEVYKKEIKQREIQNKDEVFRNKYNAPAEVLSTKRESLERAGVLDIAKPFTSILTSPMNIELSASESAPIICSRNKDLFFELEEYREEIYFYLKEQEKRHRPKPQYMRKQPDITQNMRTILVDWLVEVAEEYKLHTETLYLAVNYIDRFLSFMSVVRAKLQLVGTAAMFIASKYEEIYPPDVSEFVYITDDTYSKRQVTRMEILILRILDFDLSVPTPYTFITAMSINNKLSDKVTFLAQYLSELALLEAEPTLEILPSVMAASAVAIARHTIDEEAWNEKLVKSTGYELCDLKKTVEFLTSMYKKAKILPQQAIQEKYNSGKFLHVSSINPRDENIQFD